MKKIIALLIVLCLFQWVVIIKARDLIVRQNTLIEEMINLIDFYESKIPPKEDLDESGGKENKNKGDSPRHQKRGKGVFFVNSLKSVVGVRN